MSHDSKQLPPPLDLSKWRKLPAVLMAGGALLSVIGLVASPAEFGISWLLAFLFYLTLALGSLFLVMMHHLTDAGWSVGIRRFSEHIASLLFPWLAILFIPVILLGPKIYHWLALPATDELIQARWPVFTCGGFIVVSALFFAVWWFLSSRLRYWSLRQDVTGDALCTRKMRFHSGWGIVAFAATLTGAGIYWMKSLQYQWFSAIYGVYFFSNCAWVALATTYVIAVILQRQRILDRVLKENYFYFIGVLFFGFTLLQGYAEFAQYFVVWNANVPEETFYYLIREHGSWFAWSVFLIFGHCVLPFFILLPVKVKTNFKVMIPMCLWAWVMNYVDLGFNALPALHPGGYPFKWIWLQLGCLAFMGGFLGCIFIRKFRSHPPIPLKDPRLHEAMGLHHFDTEETVPTTGGRP